MQTQMADPCNRVQCDDVPCSNHFIPPNQCCPVCPSMFACICVCICGFMPGCMFVSMFFCTSMFLWISFGLSECLQCFFLYFFSIFQCFLWFLFIVVCGKCEGTYRYFVFPVLCMFVYFCYIVSLRVSVWELY